MHREQEQYRIELEKQNFAVGYFWGQTRLFIPKTIYSAISAEEVVEAVSRVFDKSELEEFLEMTGGYEWGEYELSYSIDLPPLMKPGHKEKDPEKKIQRLIGLIHASRDLLHQ